MGIIGGKLADFILKGFAPRESKTHSEAQHSLLADSKLNKSFGDGFFREISEKVVIDFGCGGGRDAIVMARRGAKKVIGIDIQERWLEMARQLALKYEVADRCIFSTQTSEYADLIISKDAFEHFVDPAAVLQEMRKLLKPNGFVLAAFGPIWLHPYGGHLLSVFPWAHLIFTENALMRWRSNFRSDGARCFSQVEAGLGQLTIRKFERIVEDSPFYFEYMETVPIKGLSFLKTKPFREFGSSMVRCKLIPKERK